MIEHIRIMPEKCKACRRCEVACIAAHHGMDFKEAMKHRDVLVSRVQVIKADGMKSSVRCHQCPNAPCCNVCPTGALVQEDDGRIVMNAQLCIACEMCIKACPYGSISLDSLCKEELADDKSELPMDSCAFPRREVAVRCDMCHAWRIENGKKVTACMEACPVRCLYMVEADGSIVEMPAPQKKAVEKAPVQENVQINKETAQAASAPA